MVVKEDLATDIDVVIAMWCYERGLSISWENRCALRKMVYDLFEAEEIIELVQRTFVKRYK